MGKTAERTEPLRRRPTIRDVAELAGVSAKTVSRVLNGEPCVLPETERRVVEVVTQLRFRRNEAAASIRRRGQTSNVVGLVIEDLGNPFYSVVARAIEDAARANGALLIVASSDEDPEREIELLGAFLARRVRGLIIVPTAAPHAELAAEIQAGTPVVFVDRPATVEGADSVVVGNVDGAKSGVAHLIRQGHRRIGMLADGRATFTGPQRLDGYRQALRAAGIRYDDSLVKTSAHDTPGALRMTTELLTLPDPPTAVFASNNRLTFGALQAIAQQDRSVSVVGFDDFELAGVLQPPVAVVAQDVVALGRTAAQLLFERLDGYAGPDRHITLDTELVVQDTRAERTSR